MLSVLPLFVAVLALLVVVGVLHVGLLLLAYRRGNLSWQQELNPDRFYRGDGIDELRRSTPRTAVGSDEDRDVDPTTRVQCPRCKELNDAAYTFCRACTEELDR